MRRGAQALDQGEFGEAWIHTLAAAAGLDCAAKKVERGLADFTITYPQAVGRLVEFDIKAQVKTVALADQAYASSSSAVTYDLDADTHRRLCQPAQTPTFLFLVVVPTERHRWVSVEKYGDLLAYGAYWVSLRGQRPSVNTSTERITVPRSQRLSVSTLRDLCLTEARKVAAEIEGGRAPAATADPAPGGSS